MKPDRCPHGHEHTMQCEDCATDRLRQAAAERRIERSLGSLGDRVLVEEITRLRAKVEELEALLVEAHAIITALNDARKGEEEES